MVVLIFRLFADDLKLKFLEPMRCINLLRNSMKLLTFRTKIGGGNRFVCSELSTRLFYFIFDASCISVSFSLSFPLRILNLFVLTNTGFTFFFHWTSRRMRTFWIVFNFLEFCAWLTVIGKYFIAETWILGKRSKLMDVDVLILFGLL